MKRNETAAVARALLLNIAGQVFAGEDPSKRRNLLNQYSEFQCRIKAFRSRFSCSIDVAKFQAQTLSFDCFQQICCCLFFHFEVVLFFVIIIMI